MGWYDSFKGDVSRAYDNVVRTTNTNGIASLGQGLTGVANTMVLADKSEKEAKKMESDIKANDVKNAYYTAESEKTKAEEQKLALENNQKEITMSDDGIKKAQTDIDNNYLRKAYETKSANSLAELNDTITTENNKDRKVAITNMRNQDIAELEKKNSFDASNLNMAYDSVPTINGKIEVPDGVITNIDTEKQKILNNDYKEVFGDGTNTLGPSLEAMQKVEKQYKDNFDNEATKKAFGGTYTDYKGFLTAPENKPLIENARPETLAKIEAQLNVRDKTVQNIEKATENQKTESTIQGLKLDIKKEQVQTEQVKNNAIKKEVKEDAKENKIKIDDDDVKYKASEFMPKDFDPKEATGEELKTFNRIQYKIKQIVKVNNISVEDASTVLNGNSNSGYGYDKNFKIFKAPSKKVTQPAPTKTKDPLGIR